MSDMNVSLKIKATADGEESIRATAAEVEKLGAASQRAAGDAAPLKAGMEQAADGSDKLAASIAHAGHSMAGFVAAAAGVSGLADLTRNTVELADRYGMLSARVKLATESEQEHAAAMTALFDIAQRNSASLEATAELYGKVAVSVREMGGSQADALAMTEAVSQSMRLSGASASAAEGAILQLGQALASGALRGDEFNSIAEASPRLMQALADGLGVARGELRAMAEQGKLTAEVVTQALLSQKEALASEYQQLPDTVGAALQRLRNEWMQMVGEFDQANGVTASLASGISALTTHLDDLAAVAGAVGGAVAAGLAVKGGAALLQFAGDLATAVGKAGGLRAAVNSIPASVKIGVALVGAEIVMANLDTIVEAMSRNSQAAKDAEAAQERVNQQMLEGQRAAVEQAERYRQYRDTVVLAAEQVGGLSEQERARYQEGLEGAVAYERAHISALVKAQALGVNVGTSLAQARDRMAELRQGAIDLELGLELAARGSDTMYASAARLVDAGRFAQGLSNALEYAATKGAEAAGRVDAIAGALDLLDPGSVSALGVAMSTLREQSGQAADLLEDRLAAAIGKMSAVDLTQFGQNIRDAFQTGHLAADDFARLNDQVLAASFTRLGLTAETELGRISPAAQEAIAAVDGIAQALDGAADGAPAKMEALGAAIEAAVNRADSTAALEALRGRVESLGVAGKLSGDQVAQALALIAAKTAEVDPQIQRVEAAFRRLGLQSQSQLRQLAQQAAADFATVAQSGQAAPEQIRAAFQRYAQAAVAANNGVADAQLRAAAATQGLVVAVDKAGQVQVLTAAEATRANLGIVDSQQQVAAGYERIAGAAGTAGDAVGKVGAAAKKTGEQTEQAGAAASSAVSEFDAFASAAQQSIASVNQALSEDIQQAIQGATGGADGLRRALADIDGSGMHQAADEAARLTQQAEAAEQAARAVMRVGMSDAGLGASEFFGGYLGQLKELEAQALRSAAAQIRALRALDDEASRLRSSTAEQNEDLRLQIMELDATEEEMAAARRKRALAQIQLEIKLQEIELRKASLSGDSAAVEIARLELDALREKLKLTDEYYAKKEKKDKEARTRAEREERESAARQREQERRTGADGDAPSRPSAAAPSDARPNITVNVAAPNLSDRAWLDELARKLTTVQQAQTRRGMS